MEQIFIFLGIYLIALGLERMVIKQRERRNNHD